MVREYIYEYLVFMNYLFFFKLYLIQHGLNDEKKKLLNNMTKKKFLSQVNRLTFFVLFFYYSRYYLGSFVELELKKFAERRTDIFGTGAQETVIGRKVRIGKIFFFI